MRSSRPLVVIRWPGQEWSRNEQALPSNRAAVRLRSNRSPNAMQTHDLPLEQISENPRSPVLIQTCIVCGTDFSDASAQAVEVAAAFAKRVSEPVVLVHAVNEQSHGSLPGTLRDALALYARARLYDERERLGAQQVELIEAFSAGMPDAVLLQEAAVSHARLVVLAASKERRRPNRLHGGVVERVAEASDAPTLVVRNSTPLLRWARGDGRLRVLVGADFSAPSEAALRWIDWLRQMGPCDVVVAYLEPSPVSYPAADLCPVRIIDDVILETTRQQERYFRRWVRALLGRLNVRVRFEEGWGHSDAHLIHLAAEERADLIVIGTHSRRGWNRLGHHSVSRGVLRYAPFNVACVPGPATRRPGSVVQDQHPSRPQ
jgi:nucleotide-binding universal stress UspA family protein